MIRCDHRGGLTAAGLRCFHPDTPETVDPATCAACPLRTLHGATTLDDQAGPGTELARLLADLNVKPDSGCRCQARARMMNRWGIAGCRERREIIRAWLTESVTPARATLAAMNLRLCDLAWLHPLDAVGSLIDEAIRRAEARITTG